MFLDIFRLLPQRKALHCYIILTIWILLLITGVYKYWEPRKEIPEPPFPAELFQNLPLDAKTKKIFQICNSPENLALADEGIYNSKQWTLQGLILLTRHGDRGPLQHIKNISNINCGAKAKRNDLFMSYKRYLLNLTGPDRVTWPIPGPFHNFALLPTSFTKCHLGQLTMQGVQQMLGLGNALKERYLRSWPALAAHSLEDVAVYSTRYARTFQSAIALLYGFLPGDVLGKLHLQESQSMYFCFKDCGCPIMEKYARKSKKVVDQQLKSHPAVALLADTTAKSVFTIESQTGTTNVDPYALKDALLTYICHDSNLPCETPYNCVRRQNVAGIFAYTDWVNYQKRRNPFWRKLSLLRCYGLLKHIVQQMLRMVSNSGPSFILYSGHDHTLEHLTTALGLPYDSTLLRYGARLAIEVYRNATNASDADRSAAGDVYFRLVVNGKDVTNRIAFCKRHAPNQGFCKMERMVRFVHDDYFATLNGSNFKEACGMKL